MNGFGLKTKEERQAYADWLAAWNARQREFVFHSEQISGRGLEDGDADAFWKSDGVRAHLELATILNKPGSNYVSVWLINSALTRRPNKCTRTGISGMSKGLVPEGKHVGRLLSELDTRICEGFKVYCTASEDEKDRLAWEAHDEVICSEFFKSGNARTARLVYNHVRTGFGLDTHVIRYERSPEYFAKLQQYKVGTFLPRLRAREESIRAEDVAVAS